jgi:hypothetical protein
MYPNAYREAMGRRTGPGVVEVMPEWGITEQPRSPIASRWFPGEAAVIERLPLQVDLILYGGDDFAMILAVTQPNGDPADLSTATVRSQIRATPSRTSPVLAEFTPALDTGLVTLHLAAAAAEELPESTVYDVKLDSDVTGTLIAGNIQMYPHVTRAEP